MHARPSGPPCRGRPSHGKEKVRLTSGPRSSEYRQMAETEDYSLIRWFHEHGVPQVVAFDHEVFRFD